MFKFTLLILVSVCFSCFKPVFSGSSQTQQIIYHEKDKAILEQVFEVLKDDKNTAISDLLVKVGSFFRETPYAAATLEINPNEEKLVINLREMDCTTFAENVLAISKTIKSGNLTFEKFAGELQNIRYRNGIIDGYTSRIHYFSDWIFENDIKKNMISLTQVLGGVKYARVINFMSTHPESYIQLKNNRSLVKTMIEIEKEISARETFFIEEGKIAEIESKLKDGDIVGLTCNVAGLDISHVGILVRKSNRIHLMHASTQAKKVVISEESLEDYLLNSKSVTGILVARPL